MKVKELNGIETDKIYKYLGDTYNISLNMRKVKQIEIEEKNEIFNPRPQQHIMLIAPFGSFKSTLLKKIFKASNGDLIMLDDASMPALLGTISPKNEYIEGIISKSGGKMIGIDEWDNMGLPAQQCLLSPLENQRVDRHLGFSIKTPIQITNDFTDILIEGGDIKGKVLTTCLAMSMDYNMRTKQQFALGSRFRVIRLRINQNESKKIIKGILNFKFIDRNQIVDNIRVKQKVWIEYTDYIHDYLREKSLLPPEEMLGYVNRAIHDGLRDVIGEMIIKEPSRRYIIDTSESLIKNKDNIIRQIRMYTVNVPTITKLKQLISNEPDKNFNYYCKRLNISKSQYYRLMDEIENKVGDGNEENIL
jgi:hypothetical protein